MLVGIEVGGRGGKEGQEARRDQRGRERDAKSGGTRRAGKKWFTILVGQLFIDDAKGFRSI